MHQERVVMTDNVERNELENSTAMEDEKAAELQESIDKLMKRLDKSTSRWHESTASRFEISKGKGDWRKQHPHRAPHELKTPFIVGHKRHIRLILSATLASLPIILVPSMDHRYNQAILWSVITTLVLQEETVTGCILKASARTMGTVLGAVVGGSVGYGCSLFIDISWATRSFCIFVVPLLILFSVWICNKIPYFDKNNYAALMMLITNLIIFISSAIEGDFVVGVIRVVGILIGVVISLVCNICVMPVSAERCLNELFVRGTMDVKEIVDLVMNPARLRLVNTEATAVTDNEMAGDDLNDGCGTQRHDTKVTTSEYDYRTDETHAFASKFISKIISRGDALLNIAVHERQFLWRERKIRMRSTPTKLYELLFKDLRRILYIAVQFHPYLNLDVLTQDLDENFMKHLETCLNIILIVLDYVIEERISLLSPPSNHQIPFKQLLSTLNEGLKHHFMFCATEVLKRSNPFLDSARELLKYYALNDIHPNFVSEEQFQRHHERVNSCDIYQLARVSVATAPTCGSQDITSSSPNHCTANVQMVEVVFRKHVIFLHCAELIARAYVRTQQMLRNLSQLVEEEMMYSR